MVNNLPNQDPNKGTVPPQSVQSSQNNPEPAAQNPPITPQELVTPPAPVTPTPQVDPQPQAAAPVPAQPDPTSSSTDLPLAVKKWSWGAFWLGPIYMFIAGNWQIALIQIGILFISLFSTVFLPIIMSYLNPNSDFNSIGLWISLFLLILYLAMLIYCALNGRRIAWKKSAVSGENKFSQSQKTLDVVGWVLGGFFIFVFTIAMFAIVQYIVGSSR